ncbi:MAG: hypothetical protein ACOYOU_02050 [Kiritimatiellia bacterium]
MDRNVSNRKVCACRKERITVASFFGACGIFGIVLTGLKYVYMPQGIGTADSSVARAIKDIYLYRMWYPVYLGGVCALLPAVLFAAQWILIKPGNQQPPASL